MSSAGTPGRRLPIRPDIRHLRRQAKHLWRRLRDGQPDALSEYARFHPDPRAPFEAQLADVQFALARSYGMPSWSHLVDVCQLIRAIWDSDNDAVQQIVARRPKLLHEPVATAMKDAGTFGSTADLSIDGTLRLLRKVSSLNLGDAQDKEAALSKVRTGAMLHRLFGSPPLPDGALAGAAYTLNVEDTRFAFACGAPVVASDGRRLAPVDLVLETDARNPAAKHEILELYADQGVMLPDTPTMAVHRGRLDLLAKHLKQDAHLLSRTFTHEEIYPPELGCHDEVNATQGTPLKGTTLLHLCMDYGELDTAEWLINRGADPNASAAVDDDGFGGHTPLFCTVVSQVNFWMNYNSRGPLVAPLTQLLLDHGADPSIRASVRKRLHPGYGRQYDVEHTYEYKDVTALEWGEQFHAKLFVNEHALELLRKPARTR